MLDDFLTAQRVRDRLTADTELRAQENRSRRFTLQDGILIANQTSRERGVSARVFKKGAFGFAADSTYTPQSIQRVLDQAEENAVFLGSRLNQSTRTLAALTQNRNEDGLDLICGSETRSILNFLSDLDRYLVEHFPKLVSRRLIVWVLDMEKRLLTTAGSLSHTITPRSILAVSMILKDAQGEAVESYRPYGGYGYFNAHFQNPADLYDDLDRQYEALEKKAQGVYAKAGERTVILGADMTGILAHEAIGHTVEADLVTAGSVAGPAYNMQVASELVTMVDFAHTAFGQRCPVPITVDDEGTVAEDVVLIQDGRLTNFMHNRESAARFGHPAGGNARAYEFSDEPLIRMRNTCIVPGRDKLADLIASVDDGYYFVRSGSGQADTTSEFMFGVTEGYEIKNGKIGQAVRDTTISGLAFDVLKSITMISDDLAWSAAGMCGKKQMIPVGVGGPAIRCRLNVGGR